mgnify:CR=1 FL=1
MKNFSKNLISVSNNFHVEQILKALCIRVEMGFNLKLKGMLDENFVPKPEKVFFLKTESSNLPFCCYMAMSRTFKISLFSISEVNFMFA